MPKSLLKFGLKSGCIQGCEGVSSTLSVRVDEGSGVMHITEDDVDIQQPLFMGAGNMLHAQTTQRDDILSQKLHQAFHKQTSRVLHRDIAKIASEHSPVDIAYAASHLPPHARHILFENLGNTGAKIDFLINTDSISRSAVLRQTPDKDVRKLIERMPPDEAVTVLDDIPERRYRRVLDLLDAKKATRIREIRKHPRNTAGRLMTNEFFAFTMDVTIGEAAAYIRENPGIDLTRSIFVLNNGGAVQGYVPARHLIVNPAHIPLRQVMRPISHKVGVETSREEVAEIVERYKIPVLPVIDKGQFLVGVITNEDVLESVADMADETIGRIAGTMEKLHANEPIFRRLMLRAPWLLVTLLAGLINVVVMSSFMLYANGVLAFALFFVPLIAGMSGNIGIQCSTVLLRSMAVGMLTAGNRSATVLKELAIGVLTGWLFGIVCGAVLYLLHMLGISGLSTSPLAVGLIVGTGLMGACIAGTLLGVFSPLFFAHLGVDPAIASGPIITAFNDILSMSMYLIIAIGLGRVLLG